MEPQMVRSIDAASEIQKQIHFEELASIIDGVNVREEFSKSKCRELRCPAKADLDAVRILSRMFSICPRYLNYKELPNEFRWLLEVDRVKLPDGSVVNTKDLLQSYENKRSEKLRSKGLDFDLIGQLDHRQLRALLFKWSPRYEGHQQTKKLDHTSSDISSPVIAPWSESTADKKADGQPNISRNPSMFHPRSHTSSINRDRLNRAATLGFSATKQVGSAVLRTGTTVLETVLKVIQAIIGSPYIRYKVNSNAQDLMKKGKRVTVSALDRMERKLLEKAVFEELKPIFNEAHHDRMGSVGGVHDLDLAQGVIDGT